MVCQLQDFLNEVVCLDPFKFVLKPDYGIEMALVTLVDDMHQDMDKGIATLLILLDL